MVIIEYNDYKLVKRYNNKYYIRFYNDHEENIPCEIPILELDAKIAINNPSMIKDLVYDAKTRIFWSLESFYKIGIKEYILYKFNLSKKYAEENYKKFLKHIDIRNEFYNYIMNDEIFSENLIEVEGFTAEYLISNYRLSSLGVYNYLIYLRENPKEALYNLKNKISNKDFVFTKNLATFNELIDKAINEFTIALKNIDNTASDYTWNMRRYNTAIDLLKELRDQVNDGTYPHNYIILPHFHYVQRHLNEENLYKCIYNLDKWYNEYYREKGHSSN